MGGGILLMYMWKTQVQRGAPCELMGQESKPSQGPEQARVLTELPSENNVQVPGCHA